MGDGAGRRCDLCGRVIPAERLQALPETKRCVECARKEGSDIQGKRAEVGMDVETYKDLLGAMRS
ncbi:MAG: TraR/DksA C4-type zinc finger protein [Syntrophothermus sp.]